MQLTGQQVQQIRDALLDAYPTRESLTMMVRVRMNEHLEAVADGENLRVLVFNLVSWAERTGRVDELIQGAYNETPGNEALQQLAHWWRGYSRVDPTAGHRVGAEVDALHSGPASIDVFLSYSRKDSDAMVQVREALREAGLFVWTDEGLEPGTPNWQNAVSEAVGQARAFVVLLSSNSKASIWVNNEISYAQTFGKRLFPVLVAGDSKSAVPINLINAQWVDGRENLRNVAAAKLLPLLKHHLVPVRPIPASGPVISPPRTPSPPPRRAPYLGFLLTAVAALLVGFLGYYLVEHNPLQPAATPAQVAENLTPQMPTVEPTRPSPTPTVTNALPTLTPVSVGVGMPFSTSTPLPLRPVPPVQIVEALSASTSTATPRIEPTNTSTPVPKPTSTATPQPTPTNTATPTRTPEPTATSLLPTAEPEAGTVREFQGVPFVYVPADEFKMGSDPTHDKDAQDDEKPQHAVTLPGFWIQRTEVTNEQYKRCMDAGACSPPSNSRWNESRYATHPVTDVDWKQASAYAKWFGGRLPTEAEWEKACRGTDGRDYPWGNQPLDATRANFGGNAGGTKPVGSYPNGASPYGALDMAGNVWEWTSSLYMPYPYDASDGREDPNAGDNHTLRGGSWGYFGGSGVRCAGRLGYLIYGDLNVGFRVLSPGS